MLVAPSFVTFLALSDISWLSTRKRWRLDENVSNQPKVPLDPQVLRRLSNSARREAEHARSRGRRIALIGVAAVLLSGAVATPAIADGVRQFLAQTGEVCSEVASECSAGDGEVDLSQPDVSPLIESLYPTYFDLPPGLTREELLTAVQSKFDDVESGATFEANILGVYEEVVYCGWLENWLEAADAGRTPDVAVASAAIAGAVNWLGPVQQSAETLSLRELFGTAAQDGDRAGVFTAAQLFSCEFAADTAPTGWLEDHWSIQ